MKPVSRRLLVIGCEAANWSSLNALVDAGALPNFHRLIEGGSSGTLAVFNPMQREMLWAAIATGCRARRHGISGAAEIRPDGGGVQPTGHRSWRAPAFWDTLVQAGTGAAAIAWPATRPGAAWNAAVIDERFALPRGRDFDD
jgi:predicted AlkP superfamily phosphohydrolase/phosphomutase